jgi:hypothetical protein
MMGEQTTQLWCLRSQTGRVTECHVTDTAHGSHEVTVLHDGVVVITEAYVTRVEARMRAWLMNRELLERGWGSPPPASARSEEPAAR